MKFRIHRLILLWMVATVMHLPLPVCDGDSLGQNEMFASANPETNEEVSVGFLDLIDIDYFLLGCTVPDDFDDGPVETTPDQDSENPESFPVFVQCGFPVGVEMIPALQPWPFAELWPIARELLIAENGQPCDEESFEFGTDCLLGGQLRC